MILIPDPNYDSTMQLTLQLVLTCRCPDAAAQVHKMHSKMHRVQAKGIIRHCHGRLEAHGMQWKAMERLC